jgi:flagellar protein FlaF
MSVAAYKKTLRETESSRSVERRVLLQVIGDLETHLDVYESAESKAARLRLNMSGLARAVADCQRVWEVFRRDLSSPENRLPVDLRASLVSLSFWIDGECSAVLDGSGNLRQIIVVNRAIAAGLGGTPPDAPTPVKQEG